ncbi:MAG: GatB/YqeY domain-containing protein [Rhodobacteraceae bacterium]|nr:GatB/YqeY domain-containing protein [Paracoccaceae bacterium]
MGMREKVAEALKSAMKEKAADRLSTLRLINAAIKDRDIALRGEGDETVADDTEILSILSKMVKQRQESARAYEEGGRLDLAEREQAEIEIITEFLPRQMDEDEVRKAIAATLTDIGATSIRDMGKVMGALKSRYNGQMDFGKVGPMVKDQLCAAASDC